MKKEYGYNSVLGMNTCTNSGDVELARQAHEDPFPPCEKVSDCLHFSLTAEGQRIADRRKTDDFIREINRKMGLS